MLRKEQHATDWSIYEDYTSCGAYHSRSSITDAYDLDTYLADREMSDGRRSTPREQHYLWMVPAIGGVVVLLVWCIGLLSVLHSRGMPPALRESPRSVQAITPPQRTPAPSADKVPSASWRNNAPRHTIAQLSEGVVFIVSPGGSGTGFVVDPQGYIVTNEHVIRGTQHITVILHDSSRHVASVVAVDPQRDIAVLKLPVSSSLRALPLGDSEQVQLGEKVYVLGFPLGGKLGSTTVTVSDGLVSSIRYRKDEKWFQTSAPVNPGNSGGPLVLAERGVVIGVITSKVTEAESIAFARPINSIRGLLAHALKRSGG